MLIYEAIMTSFAGKTMQDLTTFSFTSFCVIFVIMFLYMDMKDLYNNEND